MSKMILVSLPVADLKKSVAFYEAVGAKINPQFSDETAACMVFSETIHVMLMTRDKCKQFTSKPIIDAHHSVQAWFCLTAYSKSEVCELVEKAVAQGGKGDPSPIDDYDFMYGRSFEDLDGHLWGINWMNPDAMMGDEIPAASK